ncbi:sec-independent translocase [Nocardioides yefusunii]|uniref:Sec-independent translocase n=1 Tax=Nocardioides yefusunii TaxID=2500546 RepID=A0ABW1QZK3_9ACTN|nr:sec-independent translocase [Nocardioides yefusunii]
MFGMGLGELAVIAFVAVMIFGPDRLPELAKQAGGFVKQARKMANSARDELRSELGPEFADLELRDLNPKTLVRKHILDAIEDDEDDAAGTYPGTRTVPARPDAVRLPAGQVPPFDDEAT